MNYNVWGFFSNSRAVIPDLDDNAAHNDIGKILIYQAWNQI